MKNSDIALVILIAVMSFGIAYWVMGAIMGNPSERVETIDYIQDISDTIEAPDDETFNAYASNYNAEVRVGDCPNGYVFKNNVCMTQEEANKESESKQEEEPAPAPAPEEE